MDVTTSKYILIVEDEAVFRSISLAGYVSSLGATFTEAEMALRLCRWSILPA